MFPDSEGNNFPMSIKDANGPFLIMEATLFGDDKIDNEFKKTASYRYSCATVSAAIDLCRSMTDGDADPWYEVGRRRSSVIRSKSTRARLRCIGSSRSIR